MVTEKGIAFAGLFLEFAATATIGIGIILDPDKLWDWVISLIFINAAIMFWLLAQLAYLRFWRRRNTPEKRPAR
jgi:hypothetical protein